VREAGEIVRAYREQDSGCVSYVVEVDEGRLFVKAALTDAARASLLRAEALHGAIRSPTLPRLLNTFAATEGPVHVYEWVPGEILYVYVTMDGESGRADPSSPHARFRRLPVGLILDALAVIYDLDVQIAAAGFVAVLLSDGDLESEAWRGTDRMRDVLLKATSRDRDGRHESVAAFVRAWREAA